MDYQRRQSSLAHQRTTTLQRDTFATDRAAGAVIGSFGEIGRAWDGTDTGSRYAVSGGALQIATGATSAFLDPQLDASATQPNAAGLAAYACMGILSTSESNGYNGLDNVLIANPSSLLAQFVGFQNIQPRANGATIDHQLVLGAISTTFVAPLLIETLIVSRAPGGLWFQRTRAGGRWELLWVDNAATAASLRYRINGQRAYRLYEAATIQLPPPWATDRYALATNHAAVSVAGTVYDAGLADILIEHTITAATGVTQELTFRRTGADDCWIVRMDQAGSTVKIIEVVAGVETERASAAQTWTNGTSYRIVVRAVGYSLRVFVANSYKIGATSARTNDTATGVTVSHAGAELVCWRTRDIALDIPTKASGAMPHWAVWGLGDSKTHGEGDATSPYPNGQNGWMQRLTASLTAAGPLRWGELFRDGRSGATVASMQALIDADLALRHDVPDYVLADLGVNEIGALPSKATWQANYADILTAVHRRWPDARVGIARPWSAGNDANAATLATWITELVAARPWTFLGPDEMVVLGNNDGGVSRTTDGVHPNAAGHAAMALAWQAAMGL